VIAYIFCGVLAAAGGLLLGGYIAVGTLKAGDGYVLNSLAVVLIGGTSLSGGEGGVFGTLVGVAILAVLTALLVQLSVPIALRSVLLAIIVIVGAILQGRRMAS
jgi:ribose transport system permease protein